MYEVRKEIEFVAKHRVPTHEAKSFDPHPHHYRLIATVRGEIVEDPQSPINGMVVDFGHLRTLMKEEVFDALDHRTLIFWEDDTVGDLEYPRKPLPFTPTAENLARWCYLRLAYRLPEMYQVELQIVGAGTARLDSEGRVSFREEPIEDETASVVVYRP